MSSISAGLSDGTALVSTGDTTGELVLKTNGGTTAVTIGTDQSVTFAAGVVTTSPTVLPAGTASAPALTTTGDTNTGIFFPAADTIAFAEGGAEAMRINSSGQVAIGATATGGARLYVDGGNVSNAGQWASSAIAISNTTNVNTYSQISFGYVASTTNAPAYVGYLNTDSAGNGKGSLVFGTRDVTTDTQPTERARITTAGYFKQSNTGSYISGGATQNEFNSNQDEAVLWINNTNASFATRAFGMVATRSANSAYHFGEWYSAAFGDKEFGFRGDGNAYADGTWNNNGADYAEFFESANGQALTLGATVVLDGNKVREATEQDPASAVIGVVRPKEPSKASMVVGNTAWNKWANKYLTDDFDRYIMEDHDVVEWTDEEGKSHSYESHNIPEGITVPEDATVKTHDAKGNKFQHYKLNPAWNPDSAYVNRENRPEWNIIGLLGQVKILKGQPVGDRWIKMRDVSDTVEEWFIR